MSERFVYGPWRRSNQPEPVPAPDERQAGLREAAERFVTLHDDGKRDHPEHAWCDGHCQPLRALRAALALAQVPAQPDETLQEPDWALADGTLRERLEYARDQHALAAQWLDAGLTFAPKSADWHRACADWYSGMLDQLDELTQVPAQESYARHEFRVGGYLTDPTAEDECVWRVDGHSPYCGVTRTEHDDVLARRRAGTWHWSVPAQEERLDVERLARALFEAERPGDWPTWMDYVGAFGSPGIAPWRRKAERIAAEYRALGVEAVPEGEPET